MDEKIKTKVKGLDEVIGGGIPKSSSILITTDTPEKTKYFFLDFVYQGLKAGEPGIVITTETSPEDIKIEALNRNEVFVRFEEELMRWIDVYSLAEGLSPDENPAVNRVSSYLSLYDITVSASIFQSQFYKSHQNHRLVLESLDALIMRNNSQTVMRFIQVLNDRTKKAGGSPVYVLKKGAYDYIQPELGKLVDIVFDISQTDKGTEFKITKFPGMAEKVLELKVTPSGVELG